MNKEHFSEDTEQNSSNPHLLIPFSHNVLGSEIKNRLTAHKKEKQKEGTT